MWLAMWPARWPASNQTLDWCLELHTTQFKQGNMQHNQATQLKVEQHDQLATSRIAITLQTF